MSMRSLLRGLALAVAFTGSLALTSCGSGSGENFGAEEGHGQPAEVPPKIVLVNGSSSHTIMKVWIYDGYAAKLTEVSAFLPPGDFGTVPGLKTSSYDLSVDFENGVRSWTASTSFTDGTARGTQYRDFARVYPGEDHTMTFYYP
jgi:hypothetical protein